MLVSEAVVNLLLGGPGSLCDVGRTGPLQDFRGVFVQVAGKVHVLSRLCRILRSHGNDDVLGGAGGVQDHLAVQLLGHPSLDTHTVGGVHQGSLAVKPEGTGTGVEGLLPVLQDEKAVSLNRHVGGHAGGLEVALGKDGVDAGGHHAQTDFLGVHTANLRGGAGSSGKLLGNHVLKVHAAALESSGIHVGNVVADYIQTCLVVLHTGYTGVK